MNTNYFLNCVAGNIFRTEMTPAIPNTYYIGLSTSAPNASGMGVTEPSAEYGYARIQLTSLSSPSNGIITNNATINFDESTGSWGTITHFVIYDTATVDSGNLLMYGELPIHRTVEAGTIMTIGEGSLELSVQNPS